MDKFFSFFGKTALILLVIAILVGAGYYFGTGTLPFPVNPVPKAATTTAPSENEPVLDTTTPIATSSPSPTGQPAKTVTGGVTSGLSFSRYTIEVPADWKITQQHEDAPSPMDTLTLLKGVYSIKIFQAATGGALCLFPGDPDVEGPSSTYATYVEFATKDGTTLRRADAKTMCQRGTDGSYGQPTIYGHISYGTPVPPENSFLKEMDAIVATLKKL